MAGSSGQWKCKVSDKIIKQEKTIALHEKSHDQLFM